MMEMLVKTFYKSSKESLFPKQNIDRNTPWISEGERQVSQLSNDPVLETPIGTNYLILFLRDKVNKPDELFLIKQWLGYYFCL